ncbi:hypothetical protein MAPG_03100 [Magnaporthiopsis poae ATCC 64411]|uniref:Uncharacterized protein n=1 Tax=Magnaporthiopsis poae (strain ATCC 64411 / 73-15) TaxID=644358 RepID=A0A0C4DT44_MAGP6|nr:hypothetical protein MAPG_03100 [Magnaporthiopsis poae ATCC 64411]
MISFYQQHVATLNLIDRRLHQTFEEPDLYFGGRNVFTKTAVSSFTQLVRQEGNDEEARNFREGLEDLRNNDPIRRHHTAVLSRKAQTALPHPEAAPFDRAVRIYPTNAQVMETRMVSAERNEVVAIRKPYQRYLEREDVLELTCFLPH